MELYEALRPIAGFHVTSAVDEQSTKLLVSNWAPPYTERDRPSLEIRIREPRGGPAWYIAGGEHIASVDQLDRATRWIVDRLTPRVRA